MPRPPVKKTYKVEKARIKAQLDAKDEHDAKAFSFKHKKRWLASIYTHIGKAIDRIDPLQGAAVLGATILIKTTIDASEELRAALLSKKAAYIGVPVAGVEMRPLIASPLRTFQSIFGTITEKQAAEYEGFFPDWMDWIISFVIAYILVTQGKEILGLAQNLSVIVGMLLA